MFVMSSTSDLLADAIVSSRQSFTSSTNNQRELGKERVVDLPPAMASKDFSRFRENGIPSVMLMIGAVEPEKFAAAKASGTQLPPLHSPFFAPDRERTIKTAIATEVIGLRELMPPKS
jgi:hippurate hydrolase